MTAILHNLNLPMRLVALVLLAAIFFVFAKIVVTFSNPESLWTGHSVEARAVEVSANGSQNFIFSTDPFNRSRQDNVVEEVIIDTDVPETTLNLKLTGHIAGEKGSANLRTPDNKEAAYRVDDEVISDVFLKRIEKNYVVLSVNGQSQRLTAEQDELSGFTNTEINPEDFFDDEDEPNIAPTSSTGQFSDEVMLMLQNVSLRRSVKNGQLEGFKVKSNRPDLDISKFGFKKGDIITQVSGKNLTNGRLDFLKLFQEASQQGNVEITVLRNGQSQKIQVGAN